MSSPRDRIDGFLAQWSRERPDLDTTPLEVVARVVRVSGHLDRLVDGWLSRMELKWWELDVLGALRRSGEPFRLSPGELSNRLMVTSGTMTTRLDRLEEKGFVKREPAAHDRRGVVVSLTAKGRRRIDDAMSTHLANLAAVLESLSEEDALVLTDSLRALLIALEGTGQDEPGVESPIYAAHS